MWPLGIYQGGYRCGEIVWKSAMDLISPVALVDYVNSKGSYCTEFRAADLWKL